VKTYLYNFEFDILGNYCEHGKVLRKEINNLVNQNSIDILNKNETFSTDEYFKIVSDVLSNQSENNNQRLVFDMILKKLNDLKEIEFHRSIADRQKKAYNNMIKDVDLLENNIIIEVSNSSYQLILFYLLNYTFFKLDFKQKIVYGMGPRSTNTQWYNQKQASCLGFGIYYKDESRVKCLNIDIISDSLEQDANAVIRCFEFVRNLNIFKRFEKIKNMIIWSDCGKFFYYSIY
jgi:hypothetical protein